MTHSQHSTSPIDDYHLRLLSAAIAIALGRRHRAGAAPIVSAQEEPRPRKPRGPRKPTLVSVSKNARKAGIDPARIEIKPDGSYVVDIGKPEPVEPGNPWPLDEFRTKGTKQ